MTILVLLASLGLAAGAESATPQLPDDPRLSVVRPALEQTVQQAAAAGLSVELQQLLIGKVREGLAKNVEPTRILEATTRLSNNLLEARTFVAGKRAGAAPLGLVRAVAEARMAGVSLTSVEPLVAPAHAEGPARRGVEVLTDLQLRGFPAARLSAIVRQLLSTEVEAVDRVPGFLETLRRDYGLSHLESAEALARGMATSGSLQSAFNRAADEQRRNRQRHGSDQSEASGSPGKSASAPGHMPKVHPKKTPR
jgi:hypothetical protein